MTFSVTATVGTTTTTLSDGNPFYWLDDQGLGAPPQHDIDERGPQQHGSTRLTQRLDPRIIQCIIGIKASSYSDYWTQRQALLAMFDPADDAVILTFTLDNGNVRAIEVYGGEIPLAFGERSNTVHKAALRLRAPDPIFYDPTPGATVFELGSLSEGMDVDTPVPTPIGASVINQTTDLTYVGTWNEYPVVRIFGPIMDAIITIETVLVNGGTTRVETLDFTNTFISSGDYYEIDTRYGQKTVTDASGANKIDDLSDESDLATFHIARSREAVGGVNTIRVVGTDVTASTNIQIIYYNRYLGI